MPAGVSAPMSAPMSGPMSAAIPPGAIPAVSAAQFDRLAARLARSGVTPGSLQVSIDTPRSAIGRRCGDPFDERSDDDASADQR
jgi:hypothetical protein